MTGHDVQIVITATVPIRETTLLSGRTSGSAQMVRNKKKSHVMLRMNVLNILPFEHIMNGAVVVCMY